VLLKKGGFKNLSPPTKITQTLRKEDLNLGKGNNWIMQDMKHGHNQGSFHGGEARKFAYRLA
jgi:hypothetical protein